MAGILLSGPAGAGKTDLARELLNQFQQPGIVADFQSILAALLLLVRDGSGRYPPRLATHSHALAIAEYVRRAMMTVALENDVSIVVTNSDGDPTRRNFLLGQLGPGAIERVIDPGIDIVRERLADVDGLLSVQCGEAIGRWFGRL